MPRILRVTAAFTFAALAGAAGTSRAAEPPPGLEGARMLVRGLAKPGADHAALTRSLRPAPADYAAVFTPELAARLQQLYGPAWEQGGLVVKGKPGQTDVSVWSATTEDIRAWRGTARDRFPGGYQRLGAHLRPGVTFYAFKFVAPGETLGMAFDGLVHVNGHWRIFPKAYRALQ
jgi:hypothetical protein